MKKKVFTKAQTGIIITLTLILISFAAIVIFSKSFVHLVEETKEQSDLDFLTVNVEVQEAKLNDNGDLEVKIKRNPGKGEINSFKFILYDDQGNIETIDMAKKNGTDSIIHELATMTFILNNSLGNIQKISVIPIIKDRTGIEVEFYNIRRENNGSGGGGSIPNTGGGGGGGGSGGGGGGSGGGSGSGGENPFICMGKEGPRIRQHNISAALVYPSLWAEYGRNHGSVNFTNISQIFNDIKEIGFNAVLIIPLYADRNQTEIDNYTSWLEKSVPVAKANNLSSIVGIPYPYLWDPPKVPPIPIQYNNSFWEYVKNQDRVALIKQFIDNVSAIEGVTDIYWSIEGIGVKGTVNYQHLNYELAEDIKNYSNEKCLNLKYIRSNSGPIHITRSNEKLDIMGTNSHEKDGGQEYIDKMIWATNKSLLNQTEGSYNLEIRGDFTDSRNQSQNNKTLMTESFERQLDLVKQYKPQHMSVYYYARISKYHIAGVLYPEIRDMLESYFNDTNNTRI